MQPAASQEIYFFRLVDRIITVTEYVALFALWAMASLLMYDVLMRYVLNRTSDWSLDVVQLVQVTLAYAAAAPVLRSGGHISMEALPSMVSAAAKRRLEIISNGICALGSFWMVVITWKTFVRSYQISEAAYGIALPLYPWKFLVPLCFLLMALQFLRFFIKHIRG